MAYENARSRKRYIFNALLENPELTAKFQKDFFTKLMGDVALNSEGKQTKVKIDQALIRLATNLPQVIEKDKKGALEILRRIGGNVFLISGLEFELLKEIDEELAKGLERSQEYGYGCGDCYTPIKNFSLDICVK